MKNIPNFITSLNLAAGFVAIIFAANGDLVNASWLILASMIFDFLDGFSARMLKAYSEIGKELDSLADVVSFGVAPGIIIYKLLNDSLSLFGPAIADTDGIKATIILIAPVMMPVCAALRLAIFNTDTTQSTVFKGLPTPANALAVITVVIAGHYSHSAMINSFTESPVSVVVFTVILSVMMVTRIPLLSLKFSDLRFRGNEGRLILVFLVLLSFVIFGIMAAPFVIPLYIIISLLSLLIFA
jgi:CDP-diacylglycerol---serine O-phosphatidyltransferase